MRLRKILRVARWEIEHQVTTVNKKQIGLVILAILLSTSIFYIGGSTDAAQNDLYNVGVAQNSPYYEIVDRAPELNSIQTDGEYSDVDHIEKLENGRLDLIITRTGSVLERPGDEQSQAALAHSNDAIEEYNQRLMVDKDIQRGIYPVLADVNYVEQLTDTGLASSFDTGSGLDGNESSDATNDNNMDEDDTSDENTDDSTGEPSGDDNTENNTGSSEDAEDVFDEALSGGSASSLSTPDNIQPPFPFESILFGFLFLLPMSFIVQVFSSSVIDERLDYSGELLLVTPITNYDIIIGKALPYMSLLTFTTLAISIPLDVSLQSIYAVLVIAFAFLSIGFITGIFARSYKELSFVLLSVTILLFSYVLVPSIFSTIHPIAIISPLSVVVFDLQNEALPLVDLLFATTPLLLTGLLLFIYGAGIYREDDLFSQRPIPLKVIDMLAVRIHSWKSLFLKGFIVLPFVFAAQLLLVAMLFILPQSIAVPAILVFAAFTEEIAKSVPVYAGFVKNKLESKGELIMGAIASGFGFFFAEQLTTIAQLVGLLNLEVGSAVFGNTIASSTGTSIGILLPIMWVLIHPIVSVIASLGAIKNKYAYIITVIIATLVHVSYNVGVIMYA